MKTPDELRAILDALPRPIALSGCVQIVSVASRDSYYTARSLWVSPDEALFMLQYYLEEQTT